MRYAIRMGVLALLGTWCAGAEEIALVRTYDELAAAKPLVLADGTRVRVGLGDGGEAAGPWKLLYCLEERAETAPDERAYAGEVLGPVAYWVREENQAVQMDRASVSVGGFGMRNLYVALVPLRGRQPLLEVLPPDGETVLASRRLAVDAEQKCDWHSFAEVRWEQAQVGQAEAEPVTAALSRSFAAVPQVQGMMPIVLDEAPKLPQRIVPADSTANYLPGAVPLREQGWMWAYGAEPPADEAPARGEMLRLSLDAEAFVIHSRGAQLIEMPRMLLVRWWVNGRPVEAPEPSDSAPVQARQIRVTDELRVGFGYPDHLGELKEGDRLGVQVLYCSGGQEPWTSARPAQLAQVPLSAAAPHCRRGRRRGITPM